MLLSQVDDAGVRSAAAAWGGGCDATLERLDRDAFSGAAVFRLRRGNGAGDVVIKAFPATDRPRVAWVHGLMRHLRMAGCSEVPEVIAGRAGQSLVADGAGRIWEGVRFVPGVATEAPSDTQARAAARVVARLHVTAGEWPLATPTLGAPAAVTRRIAQARRMLAEPWSRRDVRVQAEPSLHALLAARLARAATIAHEMRIDSLMSDIAALRPAATLVQAVMRDLRAGHVLYAVDDPGRVAGVVDLHAAAIDTPVTDLARLMGSWRRSAGTALLDTWRDAVDAYASIRPLSAGERQLLPWLDATATVFGLDNWFRWVLAEGRRFERPARVVERVDRLLDHLPAAAAWLRAHPAAV